MSTHHFRASGSYAICGDGPLDPSVLKNEWSMVTCSACWGEAPNGSPTHRVSITVEHPEAAIDLAVESKKHSAAVLLNAVSVAANMAITATTTDAETATLLAGQEAIDFLTKER